MKIGFYPGSFNPWHEGHQDVLDKALKLFDKIIILQLSHPDKTQPKKLFIDHIVDGDKLFFDNRVSIVSMPGASIIKAAGNCILGEGPNNQYAIVRGLRNEKDFCDEQTLQYIYEDMGIKMPIFFIIADKSLVHVSSSALLAMNKYAEKL